MAGKQPRERLPRFVRERCLDGAIAKRQASLRRAAGWDYKGCWAPPDSGLPARQESHEPARGCRDADIPAPIASITKVMTAMVVLDSSVYLQQTITIRPAERDRYKKWIEAELTDG